MRDDHRTWTAFVLLSIFWGTSFLFIKIALRTIDPFLLVTLRIIIGLIGLAVVLKWRKLQLPKGWSNWRHLTFMGIVNTAIPFTLITWAESGENGIDSALAAVLNSTVPFFALIISGVIIRSEKITSYKVIGVSVGFFGIVLLLSQDIGGGSGAIVPQLAVILASLCYAIASVYGRQNVSHLDPVAAATGQLIVAEIAMVAATILIVDMSSQYFNLATIGSLLWLGLLGTGAAYILFFNILRKWGATRTTLVTYMIPIIGVTVGVIFLDEALDWRLVLGGILIIGGIIIANLHPRQSKVMRADGQDIS